MRDRRRLLLTLLNQGVWLPYSFEYLYHDLIPTTIDSKQVKNKLKLATIYGNSVVENQLAPDNQYWFTSSGVAVSFNQTTKVYTFTTSYNDWTMPTYSEHIIDFISGHKYLVVLNVKSKTSNIDFRLRFPNIITQTSIIAPTSNLTLFGLQVMSTDGNEASVEFVIQCIDLTQKYPFDTPTTLTDNRVQAILNRGYIPFNTGEIKSVDIGEFSSEPYNLFDEEWRQGDINQTTGELYNTGNNIRSTNLNSVIGGQTYTFEWDRTSCNTAVGGYTYLYIYEYDKNGNYIYFNDTDHAGITSATKQLTLTNETAYVRVKIYSSGSPAYSSLTKDIIKLCVHRTGTRTGYAPHTQPQTITFKYQGGGVGTSHDTMEIGKENVVFTKANVKYTFSGSETWSPEYNLFYSSLPIADSLNLKGCSSSEKGNIICDKLGTEPQAYIGYQGISDNAVAVGTASSTKVVCMRSSNNVSDTTQAQTFMTGKTIEYQLATPQVITIPRKHFGVYVINGTETFVDTIGSGTSMRIPEITNAKPSPNNVVGNIFWAKGLSTSINNIGTSQEYSIAVASSGAIYITTQKTREQLQQELIGSVIFYETQDEVADIIDTLGIEAGGTFTANLFSWVENQLANLRTDTTTNAQITGSYDSNTKTRSYNGTANANAWCNLISTPISWSTNKKYLVIVKELQTGQGYNYYFAGRVFYETSILTPTSNNTENAYLIVTSGTNVNLSGIFIEIIDLTLAFGSGNEPTSINDPRIQEIIRLGYIPTNTTGTYKHVDYEVLPNVDTKIKGK